MRSLNTFGLTLMLLLFFIELFLSIRHKSEREKVKDMLANIFLGIGTIFTVLLMKGITFGFYSFIYGFAFFKPERSAGLWIAALLLFDFIHYMYHSLSHKTRLFWAGHVTHHSSHYFNFSVGIRLNGIQIVYRFLFWAPLCIIGIPPEMVLIYESISSIQNFLIHTEKVGKMGAIDWVFNTPSNHRVHHGSNPEYLDKNLGGIFMIFDHLFGTYKKETTKANYGITHNIHTCNPINLMLHEYAFIKNKLLRKGRLKDKIRFLFARPGSEVMISHRNESGLDNLLNSKVLIH